MHISWGTFVVLSLMICCHVQTVDIGMFVAEKSAIGAMFDNIVSLLAVRSGHSRVIASPEAERHQRPGNTSNSCFARGSDTGQAVPLSQAF